MQKDLEILYLKSNIQAAIDGLDKNKIHVLYFSYYFNLHNLLKNPLLLIMKIFNKFKGNKSIDHINHICKFKFDEEEIRWDAKVFEATKENGMEQNDLFNKLKNFQGICYIETINKKVNKVKAKTFEKKYTGVPYSMELAAKAGIDINFLDKIFKQPKTDGGFCSWLEALFLIDQGININHIENGNPLEITPSDIFNSNLGDKRILFKY